MIPGQSVMKDISVGQLHLLNKLTSGAKVVPHQ